VTVRVDDARIKAKVGSWGTWCSHPFADTPDELHIVTARLGLRRSWFQYPMVVGKPRPVSSGLFRDHLLTCRPEL